MCYLRYSMRHTFDPVAYDAWKTREPDDAGPHTVDVECQACGYEFETVPTVEADEDGTYTHVETECRQCEPCLYCDEPTRPLYPVGWDVFVCHQCVRQHFCAMAAAQLKTENEGDQ